MTTAYTFRLFGGRDLGIIYDSTAGTLSLLGQAINIASLPASLQEQWQTALDGASSTISTSSQPPFGGDNIGQTIGAIMDATPSWRAAIAAALSNLQQDVENWNRM